MSGRDDRSVPAPRQSPMGKGGKTLGQLGHHSPKEKTDLERMTEVKRRPEETERGMNGE